MAQGDLALGLEAGGFDPSNPVHGKPADSAWPHLFKWQLANLIFFVLRWGSGQILPEREGETSDAIAYFQPFFIAFFIWPVIYVNQAVFSVWQLLQRPGQAPDQRLAAIQGAAPWWIAMSIITIAWNFAPNLWLAGLGLTGVALTLLGAHGAVAGETGFPDYWTMNVPITLHLGWGTAAALLTWNSVVAETTASVSINIAATCIELLLGAGVASFFAFRRRSALLVWTVAWAVTWVGVGTLFPMPEERAEKYKAELGEVGQYALVAGELALAAGLIVVGFLARKQA